MARSSDPVALDYWQIKTGATASLAAQRLAQRCGMAGVGVWFTVCDLIAADPTHRLKWSGQPDCDALAWTLRIDSEQCAMIVAVMTECGLLKAERDGSLSCPEVDACVESVLVGRERAKRSARARWEKGKPSTSANDATA